MFYYPVSVPLSVSCYLRFECILRSVQEATLLHFTVAVLGKKIFGGLAPHHLGGNNGPRLSEITIEPITNWGARQDLGGCAPWPQHRTATALGPPRVKSK